jgi:hypothetical protein
MHAVAHHQQHPKLLATSSYIKGCVAAVLQIGPKKESPAASGVSTPASSK